MKISVKRGSITCPKISHWLGPNKGNSCYFWGGQPDFQYVQALLAQKLALSSPHYYMLDESNSVIVPNFNKVLE